MGKVKTLRFGANNQEVISRLQWMETVLAPALKLVLQHGGAINLKEIIAEALRRGDECHNRNKSSTSAFLQRIIEPMLESDLKKSEIMKLLGWVKNNSLGDHWDWVRNIFILIVIITPILTAIIFTPLFISGLLSNAMFAVIIINSFLPITSTNMFLLQYGIDKKSTVHSVTWTTIVCVPIIVLLITVFGIYF